MTSAARVILDFRKRTGWSDYELSEAAGVDRTTITKVRLGHREHFSIRTASRLHAVNKRHLPLGDLLGLGK